MDDAIARAQGHATAVGDKLGQGAVRDHVHRLRVGRRVAEGLHDKVGLEAFFSPRNHIIILEGFRV